MEDEHPACTANRLLLEHTWQVVANEFYDASGRFSQVHPCFAFWAWTPLVKFSFHAVSHRAYDSLKFTVVHWNAYQVLMRHGTPSR